MSSEIQDYNKWTRDFSNSFSYTSQRFINFFSAFESIIDEYFENYSLLPPNESKTSDFLYRFVPDIASKIYRLSDLKDDALEQSVNILLKILNLCVFLAEQCDFKLNKTMKLILNQKQYIYKYNNQLFSMLCELFVSYDYFQRLVARCRESKPHIKNLSLVFSIRDLLFKSVQIELSEILPIFPDFINQFKGDSIRTIDSNKLNSIVQKNIITSFPSKTNNNPSIDFSPFFHFCELLIISGNLDKQLLGIKFLNSYLSNTAKNMTSFDSWIKKKSESKQLLEYLTQTTELHLEFIKSIEQLFVYLSSSHLVDGEFIDQIFITAKNMQKEESSAFFKLLIKCLISMSNDRQIIQNFIKKNKESSELLTAFILDSNSSEYASECILYLFENKALNEIKSVINSQNKKLIFEEALKTAEKNQKLQKFDQEEVKIASEILTLLITTSNSLSREFGLNSSEFINKIIFGFSFKGDFSYVYSILSSYYIRSKQPLEIEILPEIFEFQPNKSNDNFWNFMIKIMKANHKKSMNKDVVESLYSIINDISNDYFPISTPSFIEFFKYLVVIKCGNDYSVQFDSYSSLDSFKFRKLPPICMPLIIKLYFLTKEHELMNSFMFQVLTRQVSVPNRDEFKLFKTDFIPKLVDKSTDNVIKFYIVKLIYDVLETIEKGFHLEDYGEIPKRRHCEINDDVIELTLIRIEQSKTYLIRKIHCSVNDYCDEFLKRVQKIMNDPKSSASYQNIGLLQHMQLKNASVRGNCQIIVNGNYKPIKESVLSLLLTENNSIILDPLINILRNIDTNKKDDVQLAEIILKLLQFLPSYQGLNFDLSKCENYYVLIYCIQILAGFSQMDDEKINSLVNIFHSRKYKKCDFPIIQILIRYFDAEKVPKYLELLIDPLFECINNKKELTNNRCYDIYNLNNNKELNIKDLNHIMLSVSNSNNDKNDELSLKAIKLLRKITKNRKDSGSILMKNVDDMVEMSLNVNDSTVRKIFRTVDCLPSLSTFFPKFIQKIPIQSSDNKLIFKFFVNLWQKMFEDKQITKDPIGNILFKKCIEWIDLPLIDLFRLLKIIRKTIKLLLVLNPGEKEQKLDNDVINYIDCFVTKYFDILFIRDNRNDLPPIFRFIEKLDKYDHKLNTNHILMNIIDKNLLKLYSKVGNSNHYNMSEMKYQKQLYTGLQNIGSTCFVNTIVQPLFYTHQFRYNVLFNKEENENKNVMYDLFVKMLTTQRGYVKMNDFLVQFETDIEIHRQQDCLEFLLILSEKLDKNSYNLFKGVLTDYFVSTVSTSVDKLSTTDRRDEDFIHLSVNVQKFTNLVDSLKSLFGSSVVISGTESSLTSSSESFDNKLQKYSRIKVAPQFLMICLNRFEYNLKTFKKIKINSKFSFPFKLDITEYVEKDLITNDDDVFKRCNGVYKYELYAVSLHNGSADSGHYTALVKVGSDWVEFNDRSSRVISEKDVESLSFGTNNTREAYSERNAYVLYYRRIIEDDKNNNVSLVDLYNYDKIKQVFLRFSEKIEKTEHLSLYIDEQDYSFKKYSLSDTNTNSQVLISHFFNVFCHSSSKDSKEYVDKLIQKVDKNEKSETKGDTLYKFLLDKENGKNGKDCYCPKLIETFIKCKTDQILLSIRSLLLNYSENPGCKEVLTKLISSLSSFNEKPEKIDSITPLFLNYLTPSSIDVQKSRIKIAREMKWDKEILSFFDFCSSKLSEFNQKKVRASDLLIVLKNMVMNDDENKELESLKKSILESIKKNHKFLLKNSFNSLPLLDLFDSISTKSSSSSSPSSALIKMIEDANRGDDRNKLVMSFIIGLIECDADIALIYDCLNYQRRKSDLSSFFKDFLRSSGQSSLSLQQFLVDNYNEFIIPELLSSRKDTRQRAEHLTYDIFVDVKPPSNSPQYSNSRSTQNRNPTENLIRFSKGFSGELFVKVNNIIAEMTAKVENEAKKSQSRTRNYESSLFENFFRVLKWTVKRVNSCNDAKIEKSILTDSLHYLKMFDKIYESFLFIDANNSRTTKYAPDMNYRSILDVYKVIPYHNVLTSINNKSGEVMNGEVVGKIEYVVSSALDFVPSNLTVVGELSKILLLISTVRFCGPNESPNSSNSLLLKIYENDRFLNFFRTSKKVRQEMNLFDKFYASSLPAVLENSEIYRKESLLILDNPLNFSIEYSLLTTLLLTVYNLLPGKFVIKVMNWIIKCVNDQKDPPLFMETVLSINSSVKDEKIINKNNRIPFEELFVKNTSPLKTAASSPIQAGKQTQAASKEIDKNCELLKSIDKIGYKGKMKFDDSAFYFDMIKYICKECIEQASNPSLSFLLGVPDEILMKLLGKMALIDGKNFNYFTFEISMFFDFAYDMKKFAFVSQFIDGIFPLSDISNWFAYTKISNAFLRFHSVVNPSNGNQSDNNENNILFESLFSVTRNALTSIDISLYQSKNALNYIYSFLKASNKQVFNKVIDEMVNFHNSTNIKEKKKLIINNLKKIMYYFRDSSEYIKSLIKM